MLTPMPSRESSDAVAKGDWGVLDGDLDEFLSAALAARVGNKRA